MVLRWNSQRMWGSSVPSVTHRLQAAIPAGRAVPQGMREGEQERRGGDAVFWQLSSNSFTHWQLLCQASPRAQTLGCSPLSTATWIPKGTISLGNLSIIRCSCQSQGRQALIHNQGPLIQQLLLWGPSSIPPKFPALLQTHWVLGTSGSGGSTEVMGEPHSPFHCSALTHPSPEGPQHPLAASKSSQDPSHSVMHLSIQLQG